MLTSLFWTLDFSKGGGWTVSRPVNESRSRSHPHSEPVKPRSVMTAEPGPGPSCPSACHLLHMACPLVYWCVAGISASAGVANPQCSCSSLASSPSATYIFHWRKSSSITSAGKTYFAFSHRQSQVQHVLGRPGRSVL